MCESNGSFDNLLHFKKRPFAVGGVAENLFGAAQGSGFHAVFAPDVGHRNRMRHRFDVIGIELLKFLDIAQDRPQLRGITVFLLFRQRKPRQPGHVLHLFFCDSHGTYFSLIDRRDSRNRSTHGRWSYIEWLLQTYLRQSFLSDKEGVMPINEAKLNEFMGKALGDMGAAASAAMVLIGDKLGLYKAMAASGPVTPARLAKMTGTHERYVREWLNNQAAGGYVTYDAATG